MKESELLQNITDSYRLISNVVELVTDTMVPGLSKFSIRVFDINDTVDPPTGTDHSVEYFVIDRGLDTEEAYLSKYDFQVVGTITNTVVKKAAIAAIQG
jgi:hypothetical protein